MNILGISAFFHDSAAALVRDGRIVAAAQEERFTRKKHDDAFPSRAVEWCLAEAGIAAADLDAVVFYEKPLIKFERLLESALAFAPQGFPAFVKAMPQWLQRKLHLPREIDKGLGGDYSGPILFATHHESHAASAFYPSPFDDAAILTLDGVGEWSTATWGIGRGNQIRLEAEMRFPHSPGLLYSAFTLFCGFRVISGEYKLMGLAPYGDPRFADAILREIVDLRPDGSFWLDQRFFEYCAGLRMTSRRFDRLFGGPPRRPDAPLTQREMDIAASIQKVLEEIVLRMARHVHARTRMQNLCLAGGVALNCVANGEIIRNTNVEGFFVQPAAGDAGGALGVALWAWHQLLDKPRGWSQESPYMGPAYTEAELTAALNRYGAVYRRLERAELLENTAELIDRSMVVGWYQGALEWGPRALGHRSILGDPRHPEMRDIINTKIKMREGFRPFAPSVLEEDAKRYFELDRPSPHMLLVAPVHDQIRFGPDALPAVTHVDGSARIQTVRRAQDPLYYDLIAAFKKRTGCGVVINTSMNVRGEPIVNTPDDAYRCFMRTDMDVLVCGPFLLLKEQQPPLRLASATDEFGLD